MESIDANHGAKTIKKFTKKVSIGTKKKNTSNSKTTNIQPKKCKLSIQKMPIINPQNAGHQPKTLPKKANHISKKIPVIVRKNSSHLPKQYKPSTQKTQVIGQQMQVIYQKI